MSEATNNRTPIVEALLKELEKCGFCVAADEETEPVSCRECILQDLMEETND
ncbi:MAG: hypothetical protein ACYTBJ_24855 [Planctomycetota bacterium]|jgi:hypothetical protein